MRPKTINILGQDYSVIYVDKPSDVDIFRRESLWGQIDFWTHTIRVFDNERSEDSILHTLLHEMFHGITVQLHMRQITEHKEMEDVIDLLALGVADVLTRNGWLKD